MKEQAFTGNFAATMYKPIPMKHYLTKLQQTTVALWDRPSLCDWGGASFTYGQVAAEVERLHLAFRASGLKKRSHSVNRKIKQETKTIRLMQNTFVNINQWWPHISQPALAVAKKADFPAKALPYWMRWYRRGGNWQDGIDCCEKVLDSLKDDDYLMQSQCWNNMVILYGQAGDVQNASAAHQQYVYAMEYYMKQKADARLQEMETRCEDLLGEENRDVAEDVASYITTLAKERSREVKKLGLTARELEVIRLSGEGLSAAGIAERLHVSVYTVKNHKQNIYIKMDVRSNAEMLKAAHQLGIF